MGYFARLRSLSGGRPSSPPEWGRARTSPPGADRLAPLELELTRFAPHADPDPGGRHRARHAPVPSVPRERGATEAAGPVGALGVAATSQHPDTAERREGGIDPGSDEAPFSGEPPTADPERPRKARPAASRLEKRETRRASSLPGPRDAKRREKRPAPADPGERFREALVQVRDWMAEPGPEGRTRRGTEPPATNTPTAVEAAPVLARAPVERPDGPPAGLRRRGPQTRKAPGAAEGPGEEHLELSIGTIHVTVEEPPPSTARTERPRPSRDGASPRTGAGAVPRNYLRGW